MPPLRIGKPPATDGHPFDPFAITGYASVRNGTRPRPHGLVCGVPAVANDHCAAVERESTRVSRYRNRLLNALAPADLALLQEHLRPVRLEQRQEMEVPDRPIRHACFMEEGIASVVAGSPGNRVEIGMIGREGVTALAVIAGTDRSPHATFMQSQGAAWSIETAALSTAMAASAGLRTMLLRFSQVFLLQTAETAAANARLRLEGRLARWLLMAQDRMGQPDIPMTHEFLSAMLGVRRAGITETLAILEDAKAIHARRGQIVVRDRQVLKQRAGDLYGVPEAEYERLIGKR
jgi:CRP-like cAMP-binding protein